VLAISVDKAADVGGVKPYIRSKGYTFPVLLDTAGKVNARYNPTKAMPFSILIGLDGKIAAEFAGYKPGDEKILEEELLKLLPPLETGDETPDTDEEAVAEEETATEEPETETSEGTE
jgi:hypothetical protein